MRHRTSCLHAARRPNLGMSLVELLVAISIGMLVVAAMALLFASNSRSRSETERTGFNIENGRYAPVRAPPSTWPKAHGRWP